MKPDTVRFVPEALVKLRVVMVEEVELKSLLVSLPPTVTLPFSWEIVEEVERRLLIVVSPFN